MEIAGNIIIPVGIVCIVFGLIGILKFKNFFTRMLVAAKIDTVGVITVLIGVAVKHGASFFSLKVLLLMTFIVIINPLAAHMIARCAHLSGYQTESSNEQVKEYNEDHL